MANAIPADEAPRQAHEAVRSARTALEDGHLVCLFAEGSISRTGNLMPFKRGLEAIARDMNVPIVPVHLSGLWESVFSYSGGRFLWKRPRYLRHPVAVVFGPPLPAGSTAVEVRSAVEQLRVTITPRESR